MAKCSRLGCLNKSIYKGRCAAHSTEEKPSYTREIKDYHYLYNTSAWRKGRVSFLQSNPLCTNCKQYGFIKEAVDVDHIIPHQGNTDLFYDINNWQGLCKACHTRKTSAEAKRPG